MEKASEAVRLKIKTDSGKFYFLYARQLWQFNSLENAVSAALSIIWHTIQMQLNAYTESGIILHA